MTTTKPERTHRASLYRRSPLASASGPRVRAAPGSLQWIGARQTASPKPESGLTERPEFYTREAAARRLGVGKTTVWELTTRGVIGVAYIGRKPLIPAVELDRYIAMLIEEARERSINSMRARKIKT
jgi:excisionase family DNA binding protein